MIKLSILLFLLGIFHNHFYICLAYGRFARTTSNLCRHDIYMTHVYCASYIWRTSTVRSMYMLVVRNKWDITLFVQVKHRTVILRVPWVKRNCNVPFLIYKRYWGNCCAFQTATVRFTVSMRPSTLVRCTCVSRKIFI